MKEKKNIRQAESAENMLEQSSEFGDIRVNDNVIYALVRRAALGVEGVSRMAGSSLIDNIAEFVGSSRGRAVGISKSEDASDAITLEVKINMLFGYKVRAVAEAVQRAVIEAVESVTGMTVSKVTVMVQRMEEASEDADDAGDEQEN